MSGLLFTMSDTATLPEIREALRDDGYSADTVFATRVRAAYRTGRLVWTQWHLIIVGEDSTHRVPQHLREEDGWCETCQRVREL